MPPGGTQYRFVRPRWLRLMPWLDWAGWALRRAGFFGRATAAGPFDPARVERLLLVQWDHLGDAVLTTAILPELRRRFARARIDVLAAPWNRAVFAARPEVDRLLVCGQNRFRRGGAWAWPLALVGWGLWLRREQYDVAIDVRGELPIAALLQLAGAKRRIGCDAGGGGFFLTDHVDYAPGRHEVATRWALLATACDDPSLRDRREGPTWPIADTARREVAARLAAGLDFAEARQRPLVVLHVGAGTAAKEWPVAAWRELVGRLVVELDARVVLVGSDADRRRAQEILEHRPWPEVDDWTGTASLDVLAALAERCAAFVGADSGPAHVAAAAEAPVVALFSGTNDAPQWRPWGDAVRVVQASVPCAPCRRTSCPLADHPCMTGIRPATVLAAVREMLRLPGGAVRPQEADVPVAGGTR